MSEFDDDGVQERKFSGQCVDGPLQGKWLTHDKPYYRVEQAPAFKPILSAQELAREAPMSDFAPARTTYAFDHGTRTWACMP